eukprot:PLAT8251.1.p1 GENE.PLAT8251.1~~PLAT8251.1.p1  ORF type:complete len:407 (+),score=130.37 PLAT8251.1:73-1221(+)
MSHNNDALSELLPAQEQLLEGVEAVESRGAALLSAVAGGADGLWPEGALQAAVETASDEPVFAAAPNDWQFSFPPLVSPGKKFVATLIASNVAVYAAWKLAGSAAMRGRGAALAVMERHFVARPQLLARGLELHTVFTSSFSHVGIIHLGVNMYVLWNFAPLLLSPFSNIQLFRAGMASTPHWMTQPEFLALYAAGAALGGAALVAEGALLGSVVSAGSLGASDSIMALLTYHFMHMPDMPLSVMGFPMNGKQALAFMIGLNALGVAFLSRRVPISFSSHLGGALAGALFYLYKTHVASPPPPPTAAMRPAAARFEDAMDRMRQRAAQMRERVDGSRGRRQDETDSGDAELEVERQSAEEVRSASKWKRLKEKMKRKRDDSE